MVVLGNKGHMGLQGCPPKGGQRSRLGLHWISMLIYSATWHIYNRKATLVQS